MCSQLKNKRNINPKNESKDQNKFEYNDWLSETMPRYSPFIAQKRDRVVYLRDGINYMLKMRSRT